MSAMQMSVSCPGTIPQGDKYEDIPLFVVAKTDAKGTRRLCRLGVVLPEHSRPGSEKKANIPIVGFAEQAPLVISGFDAVLLQGIRARPCLRGAQGESLNLRPIWGTAGGWMS